MTDIIGPAEQGILYTDNEAAEMLGVHPQTLRRWRSNFRNNGPKFKKIGRSVRYLGQDINEWIALHTYSATLDYEMGGKS